MAGQASSLARQCLMRLPQFPSLFLMTRQTDPVPVGYEKGRVLRCMGVMAGEAFAVFKRSVQVLSALLQARFLVTLIAESALLFRRLERFRRRRSFVAIAATRFLDGIMRAGLQQFLLRRGMGIVTGRA